MMMTMKTDTMPRVEKMSSLTLQSLSLISWGERMEQAKLMVQTITSRDFSTTLNTSLSSCSVLWQGWLNYQDEGGGGSYLEFFLSLLSVMLLWREWVERKVLPTLEFTEPGAVILECTEPLEQIRSQSLYRQGVGETTSIAREESLSQGEDFMSNLILHRSAKLAGFNFSVFTDHPSIHLEQSEMSKLNLH